MALDAIALAGRRTSRLGFGGSLLGSSSPAQSKRLIAAAYEAGIRHFDVAPMYAFGRSEALLGEALVGKWDHVTVTTKYGLLPPKNAGVMAPLHRAARVALKQFPAVKRKLQARAEQAMAQPGPPLTTEEARSSLENSLRQLGSPAIDLFLMHDATIERLVDDSLLAFLERSLQEGKIRSFGVGSGRETIRSLIATKPDYVPTVQFEWSVLEPPVEGLGARFRIHHGSLACAKTLATWLAEDQARIRRWSQAIHYDLNEPRSIGRLMLKAALVLNPGSIILFSTHDADTIRENAVTAEDERLTVPAQMLYRLVQNEYVAGRSG